MTINSHEGKDLIPTEEKEKKKTSYNQQMTLPKNTELYIFLERHLELPNDKKSKLWNTKCGPFYFR